MATSIHYVFLLNSVLFLKLKTVFIIWPKKKKIRNKILKYHVITNICLNGTALRPLMPEENQIVCEKVAQVL